MELGTFCTELEVIARRGGLKLCKVSCLSVMLRGSWPPSHQKTSCDLIRMLLLGYGLTFQPISALFTSTVIDLPYNISNLYRVNHHKTGNYIHLPDLISYWSVSFKFPHTPGLLHVCFYYWISPFNKDLRSFYEKVSFE